VIENSFSMKFARPDRYLIQWKRASISPATHQNSARFANQGSAWSAGDGDFLLLNNISYYRFADTHAVFVSAATSSGGLPMAPTFAFFGWDWPGFKGLVDTDPFFTGARESGPKFTRSKDQNLGKIPCYVLSADVPSGKITFWIGKEDSLIHKNYVVRKAMQVPVLDDAALTEILKSRNIPVTPRTLAAARQAAAQRMKDFVGTSLTLTETDETMALDTALSDKDFHPAIPPGLTVSRSYP
jgi:hypothetical protein